MCLVVLLLFFVQHVKTVRIYANFWHHSFQSNFWSNLFLSYHFIFYVGKCVNIVLRKGKILFHSFVVNMKDRFALFYNLVWLMRISLFNCMDSIWYWKLEMYESIILLKSAKQKSYVFDTEWSAFQNVYDAPRILLLNIIFYVAKFLDFFMAVVCIKEINVGTL